MLFDNSKIPRDYCFVSHDAECVCSLILLNKEMHANDLNTQKPDVKDKPNYVSAITEICLQLQNHKQFLK